MDLVATMAGMARFFLSPEAWGGEGLLEGDEARHLGQVLRAGEGECVTVFDGRGRSADAEVLEVTKRAVRLQLGEVRQAEAPRPAVTLAQAVPKGKTMDLIVQKAVELGVAVIQPLVTRHGVARPDARKAEKWRRVALEACKQCGQDWLPELREPLDLMAWLAGQDRDAVELRLIASLAEGVRPMREVLREAGMSEQVVVLVGPEGDFSSEETRAALESQYRPLSLGPLVLRVETASVFCLAAIRYEFTKDCQE